MEKDKELKGLENKKLIEDITYETLKGWIDRIKGVCFRFWVFKKDFTPYEKAEKFVDESMFEDTVATHGYIHEIVVLPDNDVLIGFSIDDNKGAYIEYYKLTDIRLAYSDLDNKDEEENEEYEEEFEPLPFC